MPSAIYVGAAAQRALLQRMESLANNIANASTTGFRANGVKFDTLLSTTGGSNVSFPNAGRDFISQAPGALVKTGNPLDLAVRGSGWFSLATPGGQVYTRDGRFGISASGELQSVNGYSVLDASGAPIQLDPAAGEINVAADGMISQRGKQAGAIGLFELDASARLSRYDNSSVSSDQAATPLLQFTTNGMVQGSVEQSNVDPVHELVRLIEIQRTFENVTGSMDLQNAAYQNAIRTLGSSS